MFPYPHAAHPDMPRCTLRRLLPSHTTARSLAQAARIALGKFEVILRADCLAVDLPLLQPYLARPVAAASLAEAAR